MRRDELKPCPFCGSLNVDHAAPAIDAPPHPECLDCGASARDLRTWNRRADLETEQPVAVVVKALEWKDIDGGNVTLTALARTPFGSYFVEIEPEGYVLKFGYIGLLPHPTYEAAKAAAQQDYETRIRPAIVGVAGAYGEADKMVKALRLAEKEIVELYKAIAPNGDFASRSVAIAAIRAISFTRIADSAETGGSATLSKGQADE